MKRIKLTALGLMLLVACNKSPISPSINASSVSSAVILPTPTASKLASDADFITLHNVSQQIEQHGDAAALSYIAKGYVTIPEFVKISAALGYKDTLSFRTALKTQANAVARLNAKYSLNEKLFDSAIAIRKSHQIVANVAATPCADAYAACGDRAASAYEWHCNECVGFAFASVAVLGPLGGMIFEVGCGAVAMHTLSLDRAACSADYASCVGK